MKKRILVFSADAMVCEDVDALRQLPNFQKYLAGGCEVTGGMRTIYPSVTYPAHVSMVTGCYVGKHGVTSNFNFTTTNKDTQWLAQFNTFVMILISFLLVFLQKGAIQIASQFNLNDYASNIIPGIILFFILGSEFFINYRIILRGGKEGAK